MELMTFKEFLDIKHPVIKHECTKIGTLSFDEQVIITNKLKSKTIVQVSKEMNVQYNWVWRVYDRYCR
jgi:hypothetical protein